MIIKILGKNGFVGQTVFNTLTSKFTITEDDKCDILINCAGFSRMYVANKQPEEMHKVENSVIEKINNTKFERLIHVSTISAEVHHQSNYGKIKKQIEDYLMSKYDTLVLRLGGLVGPGLKKNVVFDILNDRPLFVTEDSFYNYITTNEVANIIDYMIKIQIKDIINVGAINSIRVQGIANIFNKYPVYGTEEEIIMIDISKLRTMYDLKTSSEYLTDYRESMK